VGRVVSVAALLHDPGYRPLAVLPCEVDRPPCPRPAVDVVEFPRGRVTERRHVCTEHAAMIRASLAAAIPAAPAAIPEESPMPPTRPAPATVPVERPLCAAPGCTVLSITYGLCPKHLSRAKSRNLYNTAREGALTIVQLQALDLDVVAARKWIASGGRTTDTCVRCAALDTTRDRDGVPLCDACYDAPPPVPSVEPEAVTLAPEVRRSSEAVAVPEAPKASPLPAGALSLCPAHVGLEQTECPVCAWTSANQDLAGELRHGRELQASVDRLRDALVNVADFSHDLNAVYVARTALGLPVIGPELAAEIAARAPVPTNCTHLEVLQRNCTHCGWSTADRAREALVDIAGNSPDGGAIACARAALGLEPLSDAEIAELVEGRAVRAPSLPTTLPECRELLTRLAQRVTTLERIASLEAELASLRTALES